MTGQCLRTLVHEDNPAVANVCFSPNGRFVLAFSLDNCIRLWDYVSGSVKKTYQGHKNKGFSLGGSFGVLSDANGSRGGAFIASASEDGDIVLWDVKSKAVVQRIEQAHRDVCLWVDVNGDTMVSAGKDGLIKVFKHQSGREKGLPHSNGVNGTANGDAGMNGTDKQVGSDTPDDDALDVDAELQSQLQAENASPQVKAEEP